MVLLPPVATPPPAALVDDAPPVAAPPVAAPPVAGPLEEYRLQCLRRRNFHDNWVAASHPKTNC
jgi:hypothetical protein